MQKQRQNIKQFLGRTPHMLAQICIAVLICGLLATNYITQRSLQQTNIKLMQQGFQNSTASISYFFSERENDILDLVASKSVTGFFSNRNLGMTMAYGLQASLNNVTRLFNRRMESARLGKKTIYTHLSLLDSNGFVLTQWPAVDMDDQHYVPKAAKEATVIVTSINTGYISFTAPIYSFDKLEGYVLGDVNYGLLNDHLLGNDAGLLFITDHGRLVFQSQPQVTILVDTLERFSLADVEMPMEIHKVKLVDSLATKQDKNTLLTLFSSAIPKYNIKLYLAEKSSFVRKRQSLVLFMAVLAALSIGGLLAAGLILRGSTKNLVLATSLAESEKREKAVAGKKQELDSIIRNFLDTLIVVDKDLVVSKANQATCQLLGYEENELLGKPITFLFNDPANRVQSIFSFYTAQESKDFNTTNELRNIELCYRAKDGTLLPMSFNISLLHDKAGTNIGVVAGAKDISSLKAAMDKVGRQKEYIENLFDVVPEGLLAIAPTMEIVTSNRAFTEIIQSWCGLFNLSREELTVKLLTNLEKSLCDNNNSSFTIMYNNRTAYFQYTSTVIQSLEGVEHVVSIRDITEEREDAAARKLLATVIEQTTDSVIITETDGTIRYVNPATIKNSGYSQEELIGNTPSIFKSGLVDTKIYQELWQTISKGMVWSGRLSNRKKNGDIIEENATISPVRNGEGDIVNFVAIKRDVTEMDILQAQLLQANKLEAIGQLAAGISHEINTPMQYVQNNVSFFKNGFEDLCILLTDYRQLLDESEIPLTEEAKEHLENIDLDFLMEEVPESIDDTQDGINRVVTIVSAMKEFSHPGTDKKTATDLNRALENIITISRNEWKYVAEMKTDFDPDLPMVPCLADQLNQVVLNLIINGAHAIDEKGASVLDNPGSITLSTKYEGGWVELRVSDTGSGIPKENRDRVFDPFFTTKEVGKGTGQGLTIAHDLVVKKHGGTIDFDTATGKGTTFIIRLPIAAGNDEAMI